MLARLCSLLLALLAAAAPVLAAGDPRSDLPPMTDHGQPAIRKVTRNADAVPRFGKLELTVDLSASYDNPFDPAQVDLTAEFIAPSGKRVRVPGFFYQPYRQRNAGDQSAAPLLDPDGSPCWKVRFAPLEVGRYTYTLRLRNPFAGAVAEVVIRPEGFRCTASRDPGFIRVAAANPRAFRFDGGSAFFPIGQNVQNDWPVYHHTRLLAEGGANCVRAWTLSHWTWLEWSPRETPWAPPGHWMHSYAGAGRYNQRIAWILDDYLERCAGWGLRVMLCLGNGTGGGELAEGGNSGSWEGHPYNAANGGFLKSPREFWTDEHARAHYRQRLRYIVARYGYSTHVWAWELWNELGAASPEIVAWHREMARALREMDPNRHLVTSSTHDTAERFAGVWDLEEIDFTQSHIYSLHPMRDRIGAHVARWKKPHVVGEGGGPGPGEGPRLPGADIADPEGVEFHASLWAPVFCGAAGTTLPWWWKDRIEPKNLFPHYRAIARFAEGVPWAALAFRAAKVSVAPPPQGVGRACSPVLFAPLGSGWGEKTAQSRFVVGPEGIGSAAGQLSRQLFGSGRREWRNPPIFQVEYPAPGRFVVHVGEASQGILAIDLDGKQALREESLNKGRHAVNRDFAVEVPAGRHEIRLDNLGSDWISISYVLLTGYRDAARHPDLDVYGIQTDDLALLWLHNRLDQWPFRAAGFTPGVAGPASITLSGLEDGRYQVEWWDTTRGEVSRTETAVARGGALVVAAPEVSADIACKIRRLSGGGA